MKTYLRNLVSAATFICAVGATSNADAQQCPEPRRFTDFSHPGGRTRFLFECRSTDGCFKICDVDPGKVHGYISDARLRSHTPNARCEEGVSWGYQGMGTIWVDHGCQGLFEVFSR